MTVRNKTGNRFALRLPSTIRAEIEALAKDKGFSINEFVVLAIAEKLARVEMQQAADQDGDLDKPHRE